MKKINKFVSILLTLVMIVSTLPVSAVAAESAPAGCTHTHDESCYAPELACEHKDCITGGYCTVTAPLPSVGIMSTSASLEAQTIIDYINTGRSGQPVIAGITADTDDTDVTGNTVIITGTDAGTGTDPTIAAIPSGVTVIWRADAPNRWVSIGGGAGTFIMETNGALRRLSAAGAVDIVMTGGSIYTDIYLASNYGLTHSGTGNVTVSGGSVEYTLGAAITKSGNGGIITISGSAEITGRGTGIFVGNVTSPAEVFISGGQITVIDTNVACYGVNSGNDRVTMTGGTITINGDGTSTSSGIVGISAQSVDMRGGTITVTSGSNRTNITRGIDAVNIDISAGTLNVSGYGSETAGIRMGMASGLLKMSGGTVTVNGSGAAAYGIQSLSSDISGGTVTATGPNSYGIYSSGTPNGMTSKITGGSISGVTGGLYIGNGTYIIGYLSGTITGAITSVAPQNTQVIEVSQLTIPAAWHETSNGLTVPAGFSTARIYTWDLLSDDYPLIKSNAFGNPTIFVWGRKDSAVVGGSSLTYTPPGAKVGDQIALSLTIKGAVDTNAAAGDTLRLDAAGIDFTNAVLADGTIFTIIDKDEDYITLEFKAATSITAAAGVLVQINDAVPAKDVVNASATLQLGVQPPVVITFSDALTFEDVYRLELTAPNTWLANSSGELASAVPVSVKVLGSRGGVATQFSGQINLTLSGDSYVRMNNSPNLVINIVNGQGTLAGNITQVNAFADISGKAYTLYAYGELISGISWMPEAFSASQNITLTVPARFMTGLVTIGKGAASQTGDGPYEDALVTLTVPGHTSAGITYPDMTLSVRTGADGRYSLALPTNHAGCSDDFLSGSARISVAMDRDKQVFEYNGAVVNSGTVSGPVVNIRCDAYTEVEIFAYNHAAVTDTPDYINGRTEENRINDDSIYAASLYNGSVFIADLGRRDNDPGVVHASDNIWYVSYRAINRATNGNLNVKVESLYSSLTGIPGQSYTVDMGGFNTSTKRYTATVDFKRNGYMEALNPDDATDIMAARFFYKTGSSFTSVSGLYYVHPGQRASYGSFTASTDCVMLIVPDKFAGFIASTDVSRYYSGGTWSIPGLAGDEYLLCQGTATLGTKVSLRDAYVTAADTRRHPEFPDNGNARVVSIKSNVVTAAFSFTKLDSDYDMSAISFFVKSGDGLEVNTTTDGHYYLLPNGVRAIHSSNMGIMPYPNMGGYRYRLDDGGIGYMADGQSDTFSLLPQGETFVMVVTFQLSNSGFSGDRQSLELYLDYGNTNSSELNTYIPISSVSFSFTPDVTITGQTYVETNTVSVSGNAPANSTVEIYDDGRWVAAVVANKAGVYSANNIRIFGGRNVKDIEYGDISVLTAKATVPGGGTLESQAPLCVAYAPNTPKIVAVADVGNKALIHSLSRLSPVPGSGLGSATVMAFRGSAGNPDHRIELFTETGMKIWQAVSEGSISFIKIYNQTVFSHLDGYYVENIYSPVYENNSSVIYKPRFEQATGWQWSELGRSILRFNPGEEVEYVVMMNKNDEAISNLWVNIENLMGGNDYVMPATYDAARGVWVAKGILPATGFFAGGISVDYTLKLGAAFAEFKLNGFSLEIPELDFNGIKEAAYDELRKITLPFGWQEDENLAAKAWSAIVEAEPYMASMQVTENHDGTMTVSYQTPDGPQSVTGDFEVADMTDPANIALAERLLTSRDAIPFGENGMYSMEATVYYTQSGSSKSMPLDDFIWMLSDGDSLKASANEKGISDAVTVVYNEAFRLPEQEAAPFGPFMARAVEIMAANNTSAKEALVTSSVNLSLTIATPAPKNTLGNVAGGTFLRGVTAALGFKDIVDNVNENCDLKYAWKEFEKMYKTLWSLQDTECFKKLDPADRLAYWETMGHLSKNYFQVYEWQRNKRMWNNFKTGFTAGTIVYTAATMGASGSAMVYTKLGGNINKAITFAGAGISGIDIGAKFAEGDVMQRIMAELYGKMTRFEHAFNKSMMLKCRPPKDQYKLSIYKDSFVVKYDPSGFAYENGDIAQRVSGVLAEIWTADDANGTNARYWDEADEWGEVNPQITGDDGWYAWDVPIGWWQVRLTKDGYKEARSEWLPVLPVQLGVNLEMIPDGDAPTITTASLPNGTVGTAYSQTLAATGKTPITWSIASGNLPGGLSLSSAGVILGTPSASGTFNFTVKAANGVTPDATKALSITISTGSGNGNDGTNPGGYTPGGSAPATPKPDDTKTTIGGNTITTPEGKDPVKNADGSTTLPNGGTITLPNGTAITLPAGTVISADGKTITIPKDSGGCTITHTSGNTFNARDDITIILDGNIPLGYRISADNPFSDVKSSAWFYDYVMFAYNHGLMVGIGTNPMQFSPNQTTTRGMMVTILYRMAGNPDVSGMANPFNDIADGLWYTNAVKWASANGIVSGYGNGKYGPGDDITREQMAVILANYIKFMGYTLPSDAATEFKDEADIASWALEAVKLLQAAGIVSGKGEGVYDPKGKATRAEIATIFTRFIEILAKSATGQNA